MRFVLAFFLFYMIKNTEIYIILNIIYSCGAKLNFQHHYSSLHMIHKKHYLLLSMLKTVVLINIGVETAIHLE